MTASPSPTTIAAAAAAIAVAAWRSARRRRQSAERLAAATLESLLNAIDANDAETGAHVRRVADYALVLAEAAGLPSARRREVERVALFHDVGKIHEALFDLVHDDDGLSPQEREAIATHPKRGADVLAPLCAFYPELPDGVVAHHERWDGGGYPNGLRGIDIPLAARIVAIADTFDAVTHARRYRAGSDPERGARVIQEGSGRQFDPSLAALFLSPPVFAEIRRRMEASARAEARERTAPANPRPRTRGRVSRGERRARQRETPVPNVSFRWRPAVAARR
ncbi:HD domain-containing phosphohydrolase [Roseisolibacter sp. H3M3-2]|uniref:HD-GYP domain-containing protein n=1 Tax=Roseisolibacter sp. H3M3-2 TaxID=3031323 RepID=UPI0023DB64D4|nr:HD domain-containing phosphohydrolase [Roseisolibacter sp. H3M3-2]MDF1504840.1 HD domain-containing protein [Roseisolibacter sp. H3M3-2]